MIKNLHYYLEENTKLHVVAFVFDPKSDLPNAEASQKMRWWCTQNYGLGFRSYVSGKVITADNMSATSRWVSEDIEYGEIRFKLESDVLHFLMTWKDNDLASG